MLANCRSPCIMVKAVLSPPHPLCDLTVGRSPAVLNGNAVVKGCVRNRSDAPSMDRSSLVLPSMAGRPCMSCISLNCDGSL